MRCGWFIAVASGLVAVSQGNTDSEVVLTFFRKLVAHLEVEVPNWRRDTIFVLDGAKYHTSNVAQQYFGALELEVIITGPYSPGSSPVE